MANILAAKHKKSQAKASGNPGGVFAAQDVPKI